MGAAQSAEPNSDALLERLAGGQTIQHQVRAAQQQSRAVLRVPCTVPCTVQ